LVKSSRELLRRKSFHSNVIKIIFSCGPCDTVAVVREGGEWMMGYEEKHFASTWGCLNCIDCVWRGNHFCVSDTKRYTPCGQIEFLNQPPVVLTVSVSFSHYGIYHIIMIYLGITRSPRRYGETNSAETENPHSWPPPTQYII